MSSSSPAAKANSGMITNHIAERAGVSVGSVYHYFPNKESILYFLADKSRWWVMQAGISSGWWET